MADNDIPFLSDAEAGDTLLLVRLAGEACDDKAKATLKDDAVVIGKR